MLYQLSHWIYLIAVIAIAELILKGFALWRAGRNNQLYWFIAVLVFNTAGVLPLIYLLAFQRRRNGKK